MRKEGWWRCVNIKKKKKRHPRDEVDFVDMEKDACMVQSTALFACIVKQRYAKYRLKATPRQKKLQLKKTRTE